MWWSCASIFLGTGRVTPCCTSVHGKTTAAGWAAAESGKWLGYLAASTWSRSFFSLEGCEQFNELLVLVTLPACRKWEWIVSSYLYLQMKSSKALAVNNRNLTRGFLSVILSLFLGFAFFSKCPTDWCSLWCLGQEILPPPHCLLYMCANSPYEDQSMVSLLLLQPRGS